LVSPHSYTVIVMSIGRVHVEGEEAISNIQQFR